MKFKSNTGITWSLLELKGILEDEDSYVTFERIKKHFGLHPFHLTNLQSALNEILSSNLNSYDAELDGFVLAYKNPMLLTPLGEIVYDTCFVHVDIEADFYVFRPKVGSTLKGIVNKKGLSHIGVLVHKAFNVSIPRPEKKEGGWPGDNVDMGQEIKFTVTQLDFNGRLPFIRGSLDRENYSRNCKLNITSDDLCNGDTHVDQKDHVKVNSFADSDGETTQEEIVTKKAKRDSLKTISKKNRYTNDDFEEPELKKKKKHSKKTDRNDVKKSVEYDTAATSSQTEEEDSASRTYDRSKLNDKVPPLNETDSEKGKKRNKRSKSSKRFSDTENEITIKTEKSSSLDGSLENIAEATTIKKKTKRKDAAQSKDLNNENYEEVNDNEVSEKEKRNSVKRRTKKSKESDSNSDPNDISIKQEIEGTYNSASNEEANEEISTNVKLKKKSKKSQESDSEFDASNISIKPEIEVTYNSASNEEANEEISTNVKSKKKSKKSKESDTDFDPNNISIKSETQMSYSSIAEEEINTNIKPKKKSKKIKEPEFEIEHRPIPIKSEINDEITSNSSPKKKSRKHNNDVKNPESPKKRSKRSHTPESEPGSESVKIKTEKDGDELDSLEERQREHETLNSNYDETERISLSHCNTDRESRNIGKSPKSKSKTFAKRTHIEYQDSTMIIKSEVLDNEMFKETIETNGENVNYPVDRVQVKTENSTPDNSADESLQEKSRTKARLSLKRKTEEKGSPKKKHSRKSRTSDTEFDFHNVTIKEEEPTDE